MAVAMQACSNSNSPTSSLSSTNRPATESIIKEAIMAFRDTIQADFQSFSSNVYATVSEMNRMNYAENKMEEVVKSHNEILDAHYAMEEVVAKLQNKLTDLEDRNRHNNEKFRGVPGSVSSAEIQGYLICFMHKVLPKLIAIRITGGAGLCWRNCGGDGSLTHSFWACLKLKHFGSVSLTCYKRYSKVGETMLLVLIQEGATIRPAVTFSPNYKKIFTTESITMTCDGGSTTGGGPNYIWYKDNSNVYNGKSYTIQKAETSDSGSYRCQTSTGEISDPAGLDVIYDWVILQTPLYVYEGDEINIRCHHYPRYSERQTRFYKDNGIIRGWTNNAAYHIGNVDGTTAGTYRCEKEVYHHLAYYKHDDTVSVSVEELFTTPTITVTPQPVFQKDNMTLNCETRLPPARQNTQIRFAFYREGQILQDFSINDIYEVYNVQLKHSGKYSCEIETTDGRVRKRSAERSLQIEVQFSHPNIMVTSELYEGDPMTLTCDTTLNPHINPTEVQFAFYRDGWEVQGFMSSNTYEVQSASLEDSGNYTCEVKTSINTTMRKSYGSTILVKELFSTPVLKVSPELVKEGANMTLTCVTVLSEHRQNTELRYAFYRDEENVQGFTSSNKYEVQFIPVEDSGTYTCVIQTSTGRVMKKSQELLIEGPNDSSLITILSVSFGLLLLIVIILIFLCIYYQRRSSNNNHTPPTAADNGHSPEGEVNYAVLAMTTRPPSHLPEDNGSNVVYAAVNKQVKASQGTSKTSTDIYQNISYHR
ncbi:Fc receptor-like protein 5 [Eleutherodactylus coqui]|uniref:Fc receptor-like protein 5 n=1 Tax=Eleutherodactylus coqui TaxID=57060 RepID=UPI003463358E